MRGAEALGAVERRGVDGKETQATERFESYYPIRLAGGRRGER
jgi:hypothetical protein